MRVCNGAARCPPRLGLALPFQIMLEASELVKAGLGTQLAVCTHNSRLQVGLCSLPPQLRARSISSE